MKFVALLSGGKDSCYNIIKCQSYGHELVCLANLFPTNTDEINSFMYQSVGHNAIPLLAKCFNVPLIRKEITGSAIEQRLQYDKAIVNDEVEDLYELLLTVKNKFPDVEGVSCGAIVSSYQRFRVENICNRLQLVPLSYLWQRDRSELLTEMIDSKVDAVLIKVAGAGLDPYKHLSKSLSSLQSTLFKLNQNFGLDLCGEGGEYETIVLDCSAFYHNKLSLDSTEIVIDEEDCSVGYLRIHECSVVEKEYQQELLSPPSLYEELKLMLPSIEPLAEVKESSINFSSTSKVRPNNDSSDKLTSIDDIFVGFSKLLVSDSDDLRSYVKISVNGFGQTALICPSTIVSTNGFSDDAIATQVNEVMTVMKRLLEYVSSTMNDIVFVHLYIANTSLFGAINGTYCQWFGVNPPSRSCVAIPLPTGCAVAAEAIFLRKSYAAVSKDPFSHPRKVLHVQSMSEWAPLCIGPYSQANTIHNSLVYVAGQIPLDPARMTLLQSPSQQSFQELLFVQLALCFRHVARVLHPSSLSLEQSLCCTIYLKMDETISEFSNYGTEFYQTIIETAKQLIRCNVNQSVSDVNQSTTINFNNSNMYTDDDCSVESQSTTDETLQIIDLPIVIIGVAGIPRNALVEVEIVAFKENNLPNSKIKYEQISSSTMDTTVSTVDHIRRQVDKWPFWKDLQETTPQRYDADSGIALEMIDDAIDNNNQTISVVNNEIKSSVDTDSVNNSCMFVDMRLKKYEQCFCTGIVWLSAANTINTGSAEAPTYNSLVSCLNLLRLIRSVIQQNGLLSINNMLTIKFYVDQHDKQIASVVHEALSVVFMTYSIPLIIIPMVSIDTTVKLIAHFFCCDLHSIDTEHWVYNK